MIGGTRKWGIGTFTGQANRSRLFPIPHSLFPIFLFILLLPRAFAQTTVSEEPYVVFEENTRQHYGFDDLRFPEWSAGYDLWANKIITDYRVPIKSVGYRQQDVVNARILNGGEI